MTTSNKFAPGLMGKLRPLPALGRAVLATSALPEQALPGLSC